MQGGWGGERQGRTRQFIFECNRHFPLKLRLPVGLARTHTSQLCGLKSSRSLSRTHASDRSHFFASRRLRPRRRAAGMTTHGVCTNRHQVRCRTCGARILLASLAQPGLREDAFECVVQFVRRNALGLMIAHGLRR